LFHHTDFQTQNGPKSVFFAGTQSWTPLVELTMISSPRSPSVFGMGTLAEPGPGDTPPHFPPLDAEGISNSLVEYAHLNF